jgi:hypothetical protein
MKVGFNFIEFRVRLPLIWLPGIRFEVEVATEIVESLYGIFVIKLLENYEEVPETSSEMNVKQEENAHLE